MGRLALLLHRLINFHIWRARDSGRPIRWPRIWSSPSTIRCWRCFSRSASSNSSSILVGCIIAALAWKPLTWLGLISYGLYMYHQPVNGLVHGLLFRDRAASWFLAGAHCRPACNFDGDSAGSSLIPLCRNANPTHGAARQLQATGRSQCPGSDGVGDTCKLTEARPRPSLRTDSGFNVAQARHDSSRSRTPTRCRLISAGQAHTARSGNNPTAEVRYGEQRNSDRARRHLASSSSRGASRIRRGGWPGAGNRARLRVGAMICGR